MRGALFIWQFSHTQFQLLSTWQLQLASFRYGQYSLIVLLYLSAKLSNRGDNKKGCFLLDIIREMWRGKERKRDVKREKERVPERAYQKEGARGWKRVSEREKEGTRAREQQALPWSGPTLCIQLDVRNTKSHKSGEQRLFHVWKLLESHVFNNWRKLDKRNSITQHALDIREWVKSYNLLNKMKHCNDNKDQRGREIQWNHKTRKKVVNW